MKKNAVKASRKLSTKVSSKERNSGLPQNFGILITEKSMSRLLARSLSLI
jgi:peroxiredoxin